MEIVSALAKAISCMQMSNKQISTRARACVYALNESFYWFKYFICDGIIDTLNSFDPSFLFLKIFDSIKKERGNYFMILL